MTTEKAPTRFNDDKNKLIYITMATLRFEESLELTQAFMSALHNLPLANSPQELYIGDIVALKNVLKKIAGKSGYEPLEKILRDFIHNYEQWV